MERYTIGILMVIGTEANHWLQPHWSWCWHFHSISTAYRHQRKRNFVTCLHVEKGGEKPRGETESQFSHLLWSTGKRFLRFSTNTQENGIHIHTVDTDTWTHFLVNRQAHKYLCWTEASFPALLYLMHIKYIFQRKSLNVSSMLGIERYYLDYCLQAIT